MEGKNSYNLEERTQRFGENIIAFVRSIKKNDDIIKPLLLQCVRSGTSVGANYGEADRAESKKDFIHKLSIANKEVKETKHWVRMISCFDESRTAQARELWKEANELNKIFSAIIISTKKNVIKEMIK